MLFDSTLLFFHNSNTYQFTSGEFVSLVGATSVSASTTSTVINLGNARDLGIGQGQEMPYIAVVVGAGGITSSSSSLTINAQFQGSTDSVNWTTYVETGAQSVGTASTGGSTALGYFTPGAAILPIAVPRRPSGTALPLYYRMALVFGGGASTVGLSTGSVLGGIVLARSDTGGTLDQYQSGFTVA